MRNRIISLLFFTLLLFGCKNHAFFTDLYARDGRKNFLVLNAYPKVLEAQISSIHICHNNEPTISGTGSRVILDRHAIKSSISLAFAHHFEVRDLAMPGNAFFDRNCNYQQTEALEKAGLKSHRPKREEIDLSPILEIITRSGKRTEGGGGLEFLEDMGDDKHLLEYKLTTAIYQNDTLIYMDNRTHWTEVFSERGEQLMYQVPQVVIDSLVTLTLQEYFKRVK